MSLCGPCTSIFEEAPRWIGEETEDIAHHHDMASVMAAADAGCYICSRLQKVVDDIRPEKLTADPAPRTSAHFFRLIPSTPTTRATVWLCMVVKRSDTELISYGTPAFLLTEDDGTFAGLNLAPGASQPAPVVPCYRLKTAKSWLETCSTNHSVCSLSGPTRYPPRLLDISGGGIRLLVTGDPDDPDDPIQGPYVTLSHCWGQRPSFLTLGADNIRSFQDAIALDTLPPNFRDAVAVTRYLGIDYLWIDSLCILQHGEGSQDDWLVHSRSMSTIYSNSFLTLAASMASSAEDGFIQHDDTAQIESPLPIRWSPSEDKMPSLWLLSQGLFWRESVDWPLNRRGWAVQERILSRRALHFGPRQLHWECCEMPLASEQFPRGQKVSRDLQYRMLGQFTLSTPDFSVPDPDSDPDLIHLCWVTLVQAYSWRALTYPGKDKLAAIAGIARVYSDLLQDTPIAGIFPRYALDGLMWSSSNSGGADFPKRWLGPYRAPTWSWASIDGQIMYPETAHVRIREHWREVAVVKSIHPLPAAPNIAAGSEEAGAQRYGLLLEAVLWEPCEAPPVDVGIGYMEFPGSDERLYVSHDDNGSGMRRPFMEDTEGGRRPNMPGTYWIVPLAIDEPPRFHPRMYGIFLEESASFQGKFQRFAWFQVTEPDAPEFWNTVTTLPRRTVEIV